MSLVFKEQYRIELAKTLEGHWYSVYKKGKKREYFIGHYPSVTTILQAFPTSEYLVKWVAENGFHESRAIRDAAGRAGTKIHLAIEDLLAGELLHEEDYTMVEWTKIKSFVDWHVEFNPEIIATEVAIFSKKGGYAGRLDCIAKVAGDLTIIDWKSSSSIHNSFACQFAAYAHAIEETTDLKIVQTAALQLGAKNKNGYRYVIYPDWKNHYKVFQSVKATWQYDNFDCKQNDKGALVLTLPETLKLKLN
jgi:hypothetical protein